MGSKKAFSKKIKESIIGTYRVLLKPLYLVLAILIFIIFASLIYLTININFYGPLFISSLPFVDKISLFFEIIIDVFKNANNFNGILLIIVSLLQGIALSVLFYNIKNNRKNNPDTAAQIGRSGIAAIASAIGLGCVPCGTSLVLPIIAIFFSGAAAATATSYAMIFVLLLAFVLSVYSIYKSGFIAYKYVEIEKLDL